MGFVRVVLAVLALAAASSCRTGEHDTGVRVGVLATGIATPLTEAMRRGMEREAAEVGVSLVWFEPDPDARIKPGDEETIGASDLIDRRKVAALVYRPANVRRAWEVIRLARDASVPIVGVDVLHPGIRIDAFVTADYVAAGEDAASAAIEQIISLRRANVEGRVNTIVIEGAATDAGRDVTTGFYRVLDTLYEANVVGRGPAADATEAFERVSSLLNDYASNVQMLLVASPDAMPGAILAARTRGVAGFLVSAGVGAGEEACRLVIDGSHDYEVDLMPEERGALALSVAASIARGEPREPDAELTVENAMVPVFYGPRRVISIVNVGGMQYLWRGLYPK